MSHLHCSYRTNGCDKQQNFLLICRSYFFTELAYSAAQPQVNKRVRATRERSRVTLRALADHSRALDASHASAEGVNCTACGSEIACVSASTMRVRVQYECEYNASVSKIASASIPASASKTARASNVASASKIAVTNKSQVR